MKNKTMSIRNLFRKRSTEEEATTLDPDEMPKPDDLAGFMRRGWAYHTRGKEGEAEVDFRQAIALDADSIDAHYGLGLMLKAQGRKNEALESFKKSMSLLEAGKIDDATRTEMLRRLTLGHINEITDGDWNLEREIWHL